MHPLNICVSFLKKGIFLPLHQYGKYSVEWKLKKKKTSKNTPKQNKHTHKKQDLPAIAYVGLFLPTAAGSENNIVVILRNINVPQKLKINIPCHPENSLLSVNLKYGN